MISAGHISGGHLNPAVTLGLLLGGHIIIFRSILYWIDQLLASSAACLLLKYLTGGLDIPIISLASGIGCLQGVVWEIVLTTNLLLAVHGLRHNGGPKEGCTRWAGPDNGWVRSGSQHPGGWGFLWSFHEPGPLVWACLGELGLDRSVGLLGRPTYRRWAFWVYLREFLHRATFL